jgi:hypothetical protein
VKFRFKHWTLVAAFIAGASAGVPISASAHPAAFAAIHAAHALGGMHGLGSIHGIGAIHGFGRMHAGFGGMHAKWGDHGGWGHGGWGRSRWNHNWNGNWNSNRNLNINRNFNRNINVNRNVNANWSHHWRSGPFARSHHRGHRWRDGFGRWHWFAETAAAAAYSYAGADYGGGSYEDESSYDGPDTGYSGDYDVQDGDGCCGCEEDENMYGDGQDCED